MARSRQRVRLQDGLWLDLNKLLRDGFGPPSGKDFQASGIRWTSSHSGEIASGLITEKESEDRGSLRIVMGKLDQRIDLIAQSRHFSGQQ
jgi:hypothetical protein